MALQIGDNFQYQGQKPNFVRDEFETLALMKAFPETSLNEGHLSFCKETSLVYKFLSTNTVDDSTGKWRIFEGVQSDMVRTIVVTEFAPSKQDNILYFEYEPANLMSLAKSVTNTIGIFVEVDNLNPDNNTEVNCNITLENYQSTSLDRVRLLLINKLSNELLIVSIGEEEFNAINSSYYGSSTVGFSIDGKSIKQIPCKLVFKNSGYYEIDFKIVSLDGGKVISNQVYGIQVK